MSCKKTSLKNKYALLEGKWRWNKTITAFIPSKTTYYDTAYADNTKDIYEIEFLKKGELHYIKNNEIISKIKLKIRTDSEACRVEENTFCFSECKNFPRSYYTITKDTLFGWNFPDITTISIQDDHIDYQHNYFQKVN